MGLKVSTRLPTNDLNRQTSLHQITLFTVSIFVLYANKIKINIKKLTWESLDCRRMRIYMYMESKLLDDTEGFQYSKSNLNIE